MYCAVSKTFRYVLFGIYSDNDINSFYLFVGDVQDNAKHEIIDEDLIRCEKYRSMAYTYATMQKLKERRTF